MKRVLLAVIDALTSRVLDEAIRNDRLPHMADLASVGTYHSRCTSVFPSITPAATAAIVTGCHPCDHGIAGAYWYEPRDDQVVYYADDFWAILNLGPDRFFTDLLYKLNHQRLVAETLYQTVEAAGRKAACLNFMIFHGDQAHALDEPALLEIIPGPITMDTVYGPSILHLGDLVRPNLLEHNEQISTKGGPFHRFGFDDAAAGELLVQMAQERALPDFTLAYFPDNDYRSHEVGPGNAVDVLENVDGYLGRLMDAYGGLEAMLDEICLIMTGDHSQSDMDDDEETAAIRLDEILADFNLADAGEGWQSEDQLVACPNLRTAQIYFRSPTEEALQKVTESLLADGRVDQVMRRADLVGSEGGYYLVTGDRGWIGFWPGEDGPQTAQDPFGATWSWEGSLDAVDGRVSEEGRLDFTDYPDALERIAGALELDNGGHLWVTARPGHEFSLPGTSVHVGGGSHGSLHALDSTVPFLVAGLPPDVTVPSPPLRTIDVAPLCLSVLAIA